MSGAEMTIRLVDGSEAEQAAFDRSPDDPGETSGIPSVGGIDSARTERSDTVEAITAGFASITDKATKDDFQHDSTATVAAMHEQFAAITNGKDPEKQSQSGPEEAQRENEAPTSEDYRGFRVALVELTQKLTPKLFSDPIERLINVLAPQVETKENPETQSGTPPVQTAENRKFPIIPAVGHVAPKQESQLATRPVGIGDIVSKAQSHIAKIPVVGKRVNRAINSIRSTVNKYKGRFHKAAKFVKTTLGRTKAGRSVLAAGSKLAGKIKNSVVGHAVSKVSQSVVGTVARTVGLSAGSGAPTAAAAAPLLANPVGLAVGAVVASFAVLAVSAKVLNDTFTSEADKLEQYSAPIASAKARQQVSTELNMVGRAKDLGPGLAKFTDAQTRFQDATQDLWTSILELMVKNAPAFEAMTDSLTALVRGVDVGVAEVEQLAAWFTKDPQDDIDAEKHAAVAAGEFNKAIQEIFIDRSKDLEKPDAFLMELLSAKPAQGTI